MEEEVFRKNKELKELQRIWEELAVSKQMEEALQKKLNSVETDHKDQSKKVADLEKYKMQTERWIE